MSDATATGARTAGLDGMRAIAALSVFVFHLTQVSPQVRDTTQNFVLYARHLDIGVEIFFVLSGFLLYRPFVAAHLGGSNPPATRSFWIRRALRIYPAWLAFLVVAMATGGLDYLEVFDGFRGPDTPLRFVQWATLTHGWFFEPIHISWTLTIEITFYLFLPAWAWAMRRISAPGSARGEIVGASMLVAAGVAGEFWCWNGAETSRFVHVALRPLTTLGAGMLLAILASESTRRAALGDRLARMFRWPVLWWALAALGYVLLARGLAADAPGQLSLLRGAGAEHVWQGYLQAVVAVCLVAPVVFGRSKRSYLLRALEVRAVVAVGAVSYGFYLWHSTVLRWWEWVGGRTDPWHGYPIPVEALARFGRPLQWWEGWRDGVLALGVSLAIAGASYLVIERPAQRWGAVLSRRRELPSPPNSTNRPSR